MAFFLSICNLLLPVLEVTLAQISFLHFNRANKWNGKMLCRAHVRVPENI